MQATPSLWKLLVETGWESSSGFKILCGGEALSRQLADAVIETQQFGLESLWTD